MKESVAKSEMSCGGGCRRCPIGEKAPVVGELRGWRLALSAAGMFIFPLILAVIGAIICRGSHVGQLLGSLGGLIIAIAIVVAVARFLRMSCKEST